MFDDGDNGAAKVIYGGILIVVLGTTLGWCSVRDNTGPACPQGPYVSCDAPPGSDDPPAPDHGWP